MKVDCLVSVSFPLSSSSNYKMTDRIDITSMTTTTTTTTLTLALALCLALTLITPCQCQFVPDDQFWQNFHQNFWNNANINNNNNNNNGQFWHYNHYWSSQSTSASEQRCRQMLTDCMSKGDLATRLTAKVGNGATMSILQDLVANFNFNPRDGCITRMEFITLETSRGFSLDFASYRFQQMLALYGPRTGSSTSVNCPGGISVATLNAQPVPPVINAVAINNNMMQTLIGFCNQDTRRYQTNCDCIQIPTACSKQPFSPSQACVNFRTRWSRYNSCPFSTNNNNNNIVAAQNFCAQRNFGTNAQMVSNLNTLCAVLNQRLAVCRQG